MFWDNKSKQWRSTPPDQYIRNMNATRKTVVCSDGMKRRIRPGHPDYPKRTGYYSKDNPETKKRANDRRAKGRITHQHRSLEEGPRAPLPDDVAKLRHLKRMYYRRNWRSRLADLNKGGWVYVISNPAFPGWLKVGMTDDYVKRLTQLNTGDPGRAYHYEMLAHFDDRATAEQEAHKHLLWAKHDGVLNEWFRTEPETARRIITDIARRFPGALRPPESTGQPWPCLGTRHCTTLRNR